MLTTPPKALQLPSAGWWSSSLGISSFQLLPISLPSWDVETLSQKWPGQSKQDLQRFITSPRVHSTSLTCKIYTELRTDTLASCFDADQERFLRPTAGKPYLGPSFPAVGVLTAWKTEESGLPHLLGTDSRGHKSRIPEVSTWHFVIFRTIGTKSHSLVWSRCSYPVDYFLYAQHQAQYVSTHKYLLALSCMTQLLQHTLRNTQEV